MLKYFIVSIILFLSISACAQQADSLKSQDSSLAKLLNPVVITAQYDVQALKNSVYKIRQISAERIKASGANNIQQVLNTVLGFRFSNDLTLGTADIELMGMSGRNLKILIDGVPLIDRADTRESLNQIDIHAIESIEIVEGPVSVIYGTDALAGVINLITKKPSSNTVRLNFSVQDESAGKEYQPLNGKGQHNQNLGLSWRKNSWSVMVGGGRNEFGGWNQASPTATIAEVNSIANRWKPKSQWLGYSRVGYAKKNLNLWYRIDALDEDISTRNGINPNNYRGELQVYNTRRFSHQVQGEWKMGKVKVSSLLAYSNLERKTITTIRDYATGAEFLSQDAGKQDVALFNSLVWRSTINVKLFESLFIQPGWEMTFDGASGARIAGEPNIRDYAFFLSSEYKPHERILLRPGVRFTKNSVYEAPKAIPSINTKLILTSTLDLRMAFAKGFRAPALRELYYDFFDASHSIMGNENLKAETSDSFNGSIFWSPKSYSEQHFQTILTGFYNDFKNRIDYGIDPQNPSITTLINIDRFKTTGLTLEQNLQNQHIRLSIGYSYVGRNNRLSVNDLGVSLPEFMWTSEWTAGIVYHVPKIRTSLNLYYKYLGSRPNYQISSTDAGSLPRLVRVGSANISDLTINKKITRQLDMNLGIRNLFNVTQLSNSSIASGGAHSSAGGTVPYSYGRSCFLGLKLILESNLNSKL